MRLGLIIPLYEEEDLVTEVVAAIHSTLVQADIEHTLVLVNNGSHDQTGSLVDDLAQDPSVVCIHLRENAGYGGGILAGLAWLEQDGMPDVVGWIWGDGQVSPSALPPLFDACAAGTPLAKAVRKERQDGLKRHIITTAYAATTRAFGIQSEDVNGCPKLMTRSAFEELQPRSTDWFLDAEVVLGAEQRNWEIATHPVVMRARTGGRSKVNWQTVAEFALNLTRWRFGDAE
jgi:glycosyltransferase involved in cell wall biosynthesis